MHTWTVYSIDSLLDGGILTGELLDISGLTATGKTQVTNFIKTAQVIYMYVCI